MTRTLPAASKFRVGRSETGLGLYATDTIEKGEFIVEYTGERITNAEADERGQTRYLFEISSRFTIDGSPRSNIARYANHACKPNAQPLVTRGRIRIEATKRIKPGEEITYNYGKSYFDTFIKPHGCRCKACLQKRAKAAVATRNLRSSG